VLLLSLLGRCVDAGVFGGAIVAVVTVHGVALVAVSGVFPLVGARRSIALVKCVAVAVAVAVVVADFRFGAVVIVLAVFVAFLAFVALARWRVLGGCICLHHPILANTEKAFETFQWPTEHTGSYLSHYSKFSHLLSAYRKSTDAESTRKIYAQLFTLAGVQLQLRHPREK
jgi:hypothetical protein